MSAPSKKRNPTNKRELWEVWRDGAVFMVQGPKARVHFSTRKTALAVAERGRGLAAIEEKIRKTAAAHQRESEARQ